MKRHFVSELREGAKIEEVFLLASKSVGNTRAGQPFLKMKLSDRSGTMDAVKWNATPTDLSCISEMDFIVARGTVGIYNGEMQMVVESLHKHTDKIDAADFLAKTKCDVEAMLKELHGILAEIKNASLGKLLAAFFDDEATIAKFREAPAATKLHHACIGGLLEHTLNVVRSSAALADLYPEADKDLVITAAALHDIGKIDEYEWSTALRFTDAGHLVGHVVGSTMMAKQAADAIEGFDPLLNLALQHAILAHHGMKEYGSPKQPKSLEAMIVHAADELDANVGMHQKSVAESEHEGTLGLFTKRHFILNRPLFKGIPKVCDSAVLPEPSFDSEAISAETNYDPFAEE